MLAYGHLSLFIVFHLVDQPSLTALRPAAYEIVSSADEMQPGCNEVFDEMFDSNALICGDCFGPFPASA